MTVIGVGLGLLMAFDVVENGGVLVLGVEGVLGTVPVSGLRLCSLVTGRASSLLAGSS